MVDDDATDSPSQLSLADKINCLFRTIHPPDRGPYSNKEVERWLTDHDDDGPTISANYLHWLRTRERQNPTISHLYAIARFFGIDPAYFLTDDEHAQAMHADLQLLAALRDSDEIRSVALRARDLSPEMRSWLARTVHDLPVQEPRRRRRSGGAGKQPTDDDEP